VNIGGREIDWICWSAMFGLVRDLDERVRAAAAAGFTHLSISPLDLGVVENAGTTPLDVVARAQDQGVTLSVIDPVLTWATPGEPALPATLTASPLAAFAVDDVLRIGDAFGVRAVSALAFGVDDLPVDVIAERFAALCDRMATSGWRVQLEFVPMSSVKDVATAWEIVRLAGRPNGGVLVDSWHFFRGRADFEALASVPGDRIFAVQLNDADAELRGSLWADTLNHRRLPGDGSFDLPQLVRTLRRIGALSVVGPEVISKQMRAMAPVAAARLAAERTMALLTAEA
jgi:sugar phosphate isomerase/epimerase